MIELTCPDTNERYTIRLVPMDEALRLRAAGVEMYDFTKLTAIDTCPTWGVLRYGLHKTAVPLSEGGRSMALECGSACHDYYAALRMWTLLHSSHYLSRSEMNDIPFHAHGIRLFGEARWQSMCQVPQDAADPITNATNFALEALHTSGYYDDPSDRKRTMSNMEVACMAYTDRYFASNWPVHVRDDFIGVECPFVLEVTQWHDDVGLISPDNGRWQPQPLKQAYYCGRIDGVHEWGDQLIVCENKTASRIGDAWRTSFAISAQVTGYTIAGTCMTGQEVTNAFVLGMQIPPTKDMYSGVAFEGLSRNESDRLRWCEWFFHGVEKYEAWKHRVEFAPRYSHSCNRYFSACMFIPFCASQREEQQALIESMETDEWSPLDHLSEKAVSE